MRRGSSGEQFLRLIEGIRAAISEVMLRTSMIVSFPRETEDDFEELLAFVAAAEFDHLGVFLYSNEESSTSYTLPDQVPSRVAQRRQQRLLALQGKVSRRKVLEKIGRCLPVLVEGYAEEKELLLRGRLESQAPEIDRQVLINDFGAEPPQAGEFRWATITAASDYDLVARLEARTFAERRVPPPGLPATGTRLVQIRPAVQAFD